MERIRHKPRHGMNPAVAVLLLSFILSSLSYASAEDPPNIVILATGGTIAGKVNPENDGSYKSAELPVGALINDVPGLDALADISGEQISQVPSQDMDGEIWLKLARRADELLASDKIDGIVITHGTDTIEETAYFLNLVVKSDKPVVLTGAMRPSDATSPDGPGNLYDSVAVAGDTEARGKGVLVVMNGRIHGARDVTKAHTTGLDAFESPNTGAMGRAQNGAVSFYKAPATKHTIRSEFDIDNLEKLPRVDIVYGYADNTRVSVDALAESGTDGIVHAGVGNGNIYPDTMKALIDARRKGIAVIRSSRTGSGAVTAEGEVDDKKYGFVASGTLNPQKSRVLLMLALTKSKDPEVIREIFIEY